MLAARRTQKAIPSLQSAPAWELLDEPVVARTKKGSFDCGFAPASRSKILAQDDNRPWAYWKLVTAN
jgi:hypothetical protein